MLNSPVVKIVGDATAFVRFDLVSVNNPLDSTSTVDHVFIGFSRDILDADVGIIDDTGLNRISAKPILSIR